MADLLSPELVDTLRAAVDRIIPADDYPSASENGVLDYIYGLIERDSTGALHYVYEAGLTALNDEARASCHRPFYALDNDERDAVLSEVELGVVHTNWPLPTDQFFVALVRHTNEGYYSDPGQGSNLGRASWEMVGFTERTGLEGR